MRLTREVRAEGGRAAVTLRVTNTGRVAAKGAGFAEDLSGIPGDRAVVDARATTGKLAYAKPRLRWTGDLAAGDSATISYAVPVPASAGRMSISTVDGDAGRTCRGTTTSSGDTAQAGEQARSSGAASPVTATEEDAGDTAATPAGDGKASDAAATGDGKTPDAAAGPALPDAKTGTARNTEAGAEAGASGRNGGAEANAENRARAKAGGRAKTKAGKRAKAKAGKRAGARAKPGAKGDARVAARRAPIPFSLRYGDNFRGAITRAANAVVTCYPPAVADCVTRRNGTGNNNVAATFIDVDSDASTFNSSTADLTVSPGAQVAYARLYWGGRSQTTTDTPGLPAGNRFAPAIAQRGQVLIKAPGDSAYRTVTTDSTIGDTPDNVTAAGIVYGASADVTALVTAAGAGTYAVGNVQAARGSDGLGAFGGWTLVVAYRDPTLPLRNISLFDGFLFQQNGAPDTTITLSGFQTPTLGAVHVNLGQVALDGDNAIVGDSLSVKTTNGPLTVLSDALHPANNFFNSTIATLGNQVTDRNPTYTNTLGYDSNIVDASSAFRNNDTSAQFTFSTVGDAYWPQVFFTQTDLRQANIRLSKTATVVGGGEPAPGSVIEYTITATNTGDDNAINVVLTDPIPGNTTYDPETIVIASGPNAGPKTDAVGDDQCEFVGNQVQVQLGTGATPFAGGTLAPGQSTSVTFRVTLGPDSPGTTVTDTATVTYASSDTPTQQGEADASASVVVPVQISSLSLLKTASPSSVTVAGRTITYSFLVTNTGDTTLTGVTAQDTSFSGSGPPPVITCPVTTLAPGASTTCTGTYVTTQADVDAGAIVNTATASGTPPTGPQVTSAPSTATVTIPSAPSIALLKTASPSSVTIAGRTITYSYQVTNTGNRTLTGVTATDTSFSGSGPPPVITCPVTTLAPGASTTCTGTYVTTQADVDAGAIVNTATASGTPPTGPRVTSAPSTATVTIPSTPSLSLLKTASPGTVSAAGQTVTYSFAVTNTGNRTLTGVSARDTAFSGSGPPPVITCPVTTLAPGASTTCTGTYTVTQADIDAGSIINTATASGTPPTGPVVTSNPSTATVNVQSLTGLSLQKTVSPNTAGGAGRTVTYSYAITNTGNRTLTGVGATDTAFSGSGPRPVITCPVTTLAPGASTTCTGTYVTTQADADAGSVVNTAVASGTPPTGPPVTSNPSTATLTFPFAPSLSLLKTAFPSSVTVAGRTITYSFAVTNTGNRTLTGVNAVDTSFSGSGPPPVITCPVTTLAPGASTTCTGTYVTTQADVNAGAIVNTGLASGTPPSGPPINSNPSTATVTIPSAPSLSLLKTASPGTVSVTYSFAVTNTGNRTLTGVGVTDTAFSGSGTPPVITCPVTTLAPGASTTCTGTYVTTQADANAGSVVDTAVASGTPPAGPPVTSNPSTATLTIPSSPSLSLLKTAFPSSVTVAGRTITYSFAVTNTGNRTLTGVTAADTSFSGSGPPPVITCPVTTLAPNTSTTCTGTYVTTQTDVDSGAVVNTAVAAGTPPTGPPITSNPSTATVTFPSVPELELLKTATPGTVSAAGQTVTYSFAVTNTGNRTLTGVTATDTSFSGTGTPPVITCPVTTLAPGASTTCTGPYTVTQADIDAGSIVNTGLATGTPPSGPPVTSGPSTATVTVESIARLALLKTVSPDTVGGAGRTVTYSYAITNTGNTTLTSIGAEDTVFSGTGTPPVITCPVTTLAPQASTTCTGTYTVTPADVDAGSVVNTATASGTPPTGPAVTSDPSTATLTIPFAPELALLKTAFPSAVTEAGSIVTYSYRVTNIGNRTLTGVTAEDIAFSGTGTPPVITCPVTTLAPGASTTCTGPYTVTQADIDAGSIVNTATASGTPPGGGTITSDPSTATVTGQPGPHIELLKTAFPTSVGQAGRTVTYSYQVVNTGNVTLTDVNAVDTAFSGTGTPPMITCPVTTLAPSESTTCTGTYTVTQADIDAGSITDTAVASGTPPTGPAITSDPSTVTVDVRSAPDIALLKTVSPSIVSEAGQTVTYSFAITNTGNTTLTSVGAQDTAFSGTGTPPVITCPVTTLAPGATTTCTGTYTVTQADIDAGTITNTALASGTPPEGPPIVSDPSSAPVTVESLARLALLKTAFPSTVLAAGVTVTYSYAVTNTGNTTLTDVNAVDTAFSGTGTPPVITCPVTTLAPNESTTCTGTYVTTQADVDAGVIVNTALASGTPPVGGPVTSDPSTATVNIPPVLNLELSKSASPTSVGTAGRTVTYSYVIVNTGNRTLTDVKAEDIAFSGSGTPPVIICPLVTLTPGASTTCVGTYTVTQADIDAGSIVNTAVASGTPPEGEPITSDPSTVTVDVRSAPDIALQKSASPGTVSAAGQTVTYLYTVTNTGNRTLTGVTAQDTAFSGTGTPPVITCPVTTLAPGASTTCVGPYTVTQADIDAGSIVNTATASGTPPTGEPVTSGPSTATVTAQSRSTLSLQKTAFPSTVLAAGLTVSYSYAITNTGNTTLTDVSAQDTAFSGTGTPPVITCPVTTLAPQESTTCTGTYVTTQADVNAGSIVNTAAASGTPPTGPAVTSGPSTATVTIPPISNLRLLKTVFPTSVGVAGRTVTYSYAIVNDGNRTLTDVKAEDIVFSGTGTPPVITCPVTTLPPGAAVTCTGTYTVTQADIDAGSIVNTAVASGTPPEGPPVVSGPSSATVIVQSAPGIVLLKTAAPVTVSAAGQTVTYFYGIVNPGNRTLTDVKAEDIAFSGTGTPPVITCPVTTLPPGAAVTCTGTYTVTQADIDAGSIINTATASGTPPGGEPITSGPSTAGVTVASLPRLSLQKTAFPSTVLAAGLTVSYSYAITNTGNATLTDVNATDTAFSGSGPPPVITCPVTTLAPGASTTCTGTYVTTQADVNAGSIVNTAVASGTPPTGPAVTSGPSTATVTIPSRPGLSLDKTAFPSTVLAAGVTVAYSYDVVNTGNVPLTDVSATDTAFSGTGTPPVITCPVTTLAPGASTICTGTYVTTQADVDAGSIVNTATASGAPPEGPRVVSDPSTATVTIPPVLGLSLLKSATPSVVTTAGQTVTYSYALVNDSNRTLTNVSARDTAFSGSGTPPVITCPVTTLAPGATTTCTGTYAVTQADLNAGSVVNTAVATGTPPEGEPITSGPSTATVTAESAPGLSVLKSSSPTFVLRAGETLTYSYLVTNIGNRTLTDVSVEDIVFTGTGTPPVITCPVTTLEPGASTTCTGTYVTTQDDIDTGSITDTAVATGTPPTGPPVTSEPSTLVVPDDEMPAVSLLKSASPATVSAPDQTVTYSFLVTNTGNLTLRNISVEDTAFSGSGTPPVITCPDVRLAPTVSATCTGTYAVTQADLDAGSITNTAVARAVPPEGAPVFSEPSNATVTAAVDSSLVLVKSASPTTVTAANQTVTYSFLVTNTGNVELRNLSASDTAFSGTGTPPVITCPDTPLAPGASATCTGTYVTTQADIDAGSIRNTGTASGTQPLGGVTLSNPSTATVTATPTASLALAKSASPATVTAANQTVTYSYLVTNTGNVTLRRLSATDTAFSGTGTPPVITCPATPLAPGASATCTGTYVTTQADIDAGTITNTATASGTPPEGPAVTSEPSNATVTATANAALTLAKSASPTRVTAAGQTVTYSYLVTNTGNVTLRRVSATDTAFSGSGTPPVITCPATPLAPGASLTCTGTYRVTAADLIAGSITNTATASGTPPSGPAVTSNSSTVTVIAVAPRPRPRPELVRSRAHDRSSSGEEAGYARDTQDITSVSRNRTKVIGDMDGCSGRSHASRRCRAHDRRHDGHLFHPDSGGRIADPPHRRHHRRQGTMPARRLHGKSHRHGG
ncbi:hypothetical protein AB0D67_19110 [Streptosporangium sp. NPDC048047]|uniref:DUF7507 domain-containing protein n=1 Tax=Streptosporangium sp. NPDC048047 TaxID=3155748 RepID=UPI00341D207D